jgi:pimeloyl-ACP methyl ester carboxylesterase
MTSSPGPPRPVRVRLSDSVVNCSVSGSGPVVVLLHGWPQTRHAWRRVVPLLEPSCTVVVPDLPGFGASSKSLATHDKRAVARILQELMQTLGHDAFHLVGHDVGGQVLYPWAGAAPDSVRSVTFVEAGIPGLGDSERAANPLLGGSWHFGFNMVPDLPEFLLAGRERAYLEHMFRRDSIGLFVTDAIDDAALDVYARALASVGAVRASMSHYRALPRDIEDNRAAVRDGVLGAPAVVVGAEHGIGLSWLASVGEAFTHVAHHLLAGSGHYVPEEQPDRLAAIILAAVHQAENSTTDQGRTA